MSYRWFDARLVARRRLSPSFVRITLGGEQLSLVAGVNHDQRVKLAVGDADALDAMSGAENWYTRWAELGSCAPAIRTYTLVGVRPEVGEVDIDVVLHPQAAGPASNFAATAEIGARVGLVAPDRSVPGHESMGLGWHPGDATSFTLVADETALPALANILAALASDARGTALLELPTAADMPELSRPEGIDVIFFVRERGESVLDVLGCGTGIRETSEDDTLLWEEALGPDAHGWYGWVAGEAGWARQVRQALRGAGRDRSQASVMGYWRRGIPQC